MMVDEISDDRIAALKDEAKVAREGDFAVGYEAGRHWATDASYTDLRIAMISALEASYIWETDDRAQMRVVALAEAMGIEPEEFDEIIGFDGNRHCRAVLDGFFKAVREYVEAAENRGVRF